jgi:hypothetical protein
MPKSNKRRMAGFWTVSRIRIVQTMQAHRQSVEEIADALGCSVETVTDFLLSQVDGTGPGVVSDRLFFEMWRGGAG